MRTAQNIFPILLVTGSMWLGITEASITRGPYLQRVSDDEITVRWRSDVAQTGTVFYGESEGVLTNHLAEGQSQTNHVHRLTGLEPDTTYYYSINQGTNVLAGGPDFRFQTAPVPGSESARRIWIVGDSGTSGFSSVYEAYQAYNGSQYTDLMLMLGDNAYDDGTDAEYQTRVFDLIPEILRQTPLFSCFSNHDGISADSSTQTGPYYEIFTLPSAAECGGVASGTEAYYSFDFGDIHFISLDSFETARATNGAMHIWLEQDLAATTSKWMVAFWHHPPYSKGNHDSDTGGELIEMRQNFLPLLESAGVDLVLSGHSHLYERSYLLHEHYGDSSSFDLATHAVDSGDGAETGDGAYTKATNGFYAGRGAVYMVAGSSGKTSDTRPDFPHPAMSASHVEMGSVVIDVASNRMDIVFLNSVGIVRDSLTLLKISVGPGDSDGDGLPDAWEQFYFGSPTNAVSAEDPDGDGLDNRSEYIAATHPNNLASILMLDGITASNGAPVIVNWNSVAGRIYNIGWRENLQEAAFSNVSADLAFPQNSYTDTVERAGSVHFYRVDVRLDQ